MIVVALALVTSPLASPAHEIPADITVQAFVKPKGQVLRFLVRVPLRAMRDMEFPLRGPGYLDLEHIDQEARNAATLWIGNEVMFYEDNELLPVGELKAVQISLPSDRSFETFDEALAHVTGPSLPNTLALFWEQAMLDVLFEYPIRSDQSDFAVRPGLDRLALRVATVLRFLPPGKGVRAFEYTGDAGLVRLDPRWYQAAARFVWSGFTHILDGVDHLLFLLCLVIPLRRIRTLIVVITAFTVAHSITLLASALGLAPNALWFPPLVETLIAASIVYMALENIVGANLERRWLITFGFGLIHGFGFSFVLRERLQFAGAHLLTSLLSFNVGVEFGQLLVLLILVPVLNLLFKYGVKERMGTIILSALVAHTGWHWMTARAQRLMEYRGQWPVLDRAAVLRVMPWILVALLVAGGGWAGVVAYRRHSRTAPAARRVPEVP
jgi:HupE / UreJ protein